MIKEEEEEGKRWEIGEKKGEEGETGGKRGRGDNERIRDKQKKKRRE